MGKVTKTCCIEGCFNKSGNTESIRHSFHRFPSKNDENYQSWVAAVTPYRKMCKKPPEGAQKNFYVCDEHFDNSCFLEGDHTILVDGIVKTISRKKRRLKENSVPSIFKGLKIENSNMNNSIDCIYEDTVDYIDIPQFVKIDSKTELQIDSTHDTEKYTVSKNEISFSRYSKETLIRDWMDNHLTTGLNYWRMVVTTGNIFFVYTCSMSIARVLTVTEDMTTELQLSGRSSTFSIVNHIECFEDLSSTLKTIGCLKMCLGISCKVGYFKTKTQSRRVRCSECQKFYRSEKDKELKKKKRALQKTTSETKRKQSVVPKV